MDQLTSIDTKDIATINTKLDTKFDSQNLVEYANVFTYAFKEIEDLVNQKEWTVSDCEMLYLFLEEKCRVATEGTCIEVRKSCSEVTSKFVGSDPCSACPFNKFCSYAFDNVWHLNFVKISDRLLEIVRFQKRVTDEDKQYITACYNEMLKSNDLKDLIEMVSKWGTTK